MLKTLAHIAPLLNFPFLVVRQHLVWHYLIASLLSHSLSHDSIGNKLAFCSSCVLAAAIYNQAAVNIAAEGLVAAEKQVTHTGFGLIVQLQFIASYILRNDS